MRSKNLPGAQVAIRALVAIALRKKVLCEFLDQIVRIITSPAT
jgi:hypothetical protein